MERAKTPPRAKETVATHPASPPTPDVTRRIEENRLKAKAIRDQYEASRRSAATTSTPNASSTTPTSSRKRDHSAISTSNIPSTSRDARNSPSKPAGSKDAGDTLPARKFTKFVDYDFSKMSDTKGGFMSAEDDPTNRVLHAPQKADQGKPAHMTLREWERHQLLKNLKRQKAGPFEPGISALNNDKERKKCRECGSLEIDFVWEEVFGCAVCNRCKEAKPELYSLLTKTEAKDDYLLTDPELKDEELLPHLNKPNPHKSHWHDMMLFLRYQVEEYAFSERKWGSAEKLDEEFEKREEQKKKRKEEKFRGKLEELKRKTRAEAYRRNMQGKGGGRFGEKVGGGKHEHEWGRAVERDDGVTVKSCTECGMEVEELEF